MKRHNASHGDFKAVEESHGTHGGPAGIIIGVVVVAVAIAVIGIAVFLYTVRRRRQKQITRTLGH